MFLFQPGVDLREIVDAVNQVGATPSSLIAILEALKSSGSSASRASGYLMNTGNLDTYFDFKGWVSSRLSLTAPKGTRPSQSRETIRGLFYR